MQTRHWPGAAANPSLGPQFLADVQALNARLPAGGPWLNLTHDRYRFALGLGAALMRGQANLMPPNHTADLLARLQAAFPQMQAMVDTEDARLPMPAWVHGKSFAPITDAARAVPLIDDQVIAAHVLTSGSTGAPVPHDKRWGLLVRNTAAGAKRLAELMKRESLQGVSLVATVPAQHMYGFESTVLVAMLGGAAFEVDRPFFPADIAAALARLPRPRMLVTTPFHLKTLLDAGLALPTVDLVVCATAPLAPQLAARSEDLFSAPLAEIYGCTEAGQVATRRPTCGPEWQAFDGLSLHHDAHGQTLVQGGHVPQPTPLADEIDAISPTTFRLLGRANDLINVAGKRSSLSHLNFHLNQIEGVQDGAFWLPPEADAASSGVTRTVAFVVAPQVPPERLHETVVGALRARLDPAFCRAV